MTGPARPRTKRMGAGLALLSGVALLSGCDDGTALDATTVLNYNRCQGLEPGLTRVDYAAVAGIRGGTLLGITEPDDGESASADDELLLVAISRGRQPTPGYGFTLEEAHRRDQVAVIEVRWETPASGAVLAQTLTHPCLVVGLPGNGFEQVEVVDQTGKTLGTLDL